MTNWRQFKITDKNVYPRYIRFNLDDRVRYRNGGYNWVDCKNRAPFDGLAVGDVIEIDTDRSCNYDGGHEFPDTSIVRQSMAITPFNPSSSSVIPSGFREGFLSNVGNAYQSGEDFQAFIEQRDRNGRVDFQWYGTSKNGNFQQGVFDRRKK